MYIGPWQEYSLSKERRKNPSTNNNSLTSEFRKGIEDAIASTLDPSSAQAAIQAMEMYLKEHQGSSSNDVRFPPIQQSQPRRQRNLYHPRAFVNDTKLPLINTMISTPPSSSSRIRKVNSARDKIPSAASTPVSVRSTQSEPVSTTRFPNLFNDSNTTNNNKRNNPSKSSLKRTSKLAATTSLGIAAMDNADPLNLNQTRPSNHQSGRTRSSMAEYYDTNAAMELLKMDRMERAKAEIGKLAGWKVSKGQNQSSKNSKSSKPKEDGIDPAKEEKIELIKNMKDLYMTHLVETNESTKTTTTTTASTSPKPAQTASINVNTKVIHRDLSPIGSPVIKEMDVTQNDMMLVSKYFKTNKPKDNSTTPKKNPPQQLQDEVEEQLAMQKAEESVFSPKKKPPAYHTLDDSDFEQENVQDDEVFNISQSGKFQSKPIIEQDAPFMDELFTGGGVDSLLKWSAQLDFDDL